jgi:hypothetical protein
MEKLVMIKEQLALSERNYTDRNGVSFNKKTEKNKQKQRKTKGFFLFYMFFPVLLTNSIYYQRVDSAK